MCPPCTYVSKFLSHATISSAEQLRRAGRNRLTGEVTGTYYTGMAAAGCWCCAGLKQWLPMLTSAELCSFLHEAGKLPEADQAIQIRVC